MNEICTIDRVLFSVAFHLINCVWNVCIALTTSKILALLPLWAIVAFKKKNVIVFRVSQQRAVNQLNLIS